MTETMREPKSEKVHPDGLGVQRLYEFDNGYGASVIQSSISYGSGAGLWELAVLDSKGDVAYNTPITKHSLGWLTVEKVNEALAQIKALPPKKVQVG